MEDTHSIDIEEPLLPVEEEADVLGSFRKWHAAYTKVRKSYIDSQRRISTFEKEKSDLEEQNSSLLLEKSTLQTENSTLKLEVSNFEKKETALEQEYSSVKRLKSAWETEKSKLLKKIDKEIAEKSEMKQQVSFFTRDNETLQIKVLELKSKNLVARTEILALKEEKLALELQKLDLELRLQSLVPPVHVSKKEVLLTTFAYVAGTSYFCFKKPSYYSSKGANNSRFLHALFYTIVTLHTIGFGDVVPVRNASKAVAFLLVLMGVHMTVVTNILVDRILGFFVRKCSFLLGYSMEVRRGILTIFAIIAVIIILAIGMCGIHYCEDRHLDIVELFYDSFITLSTVGYGDFKFTSDTGRTFAVIWILVCCPIFTGACTFVVEFFVYDFRLMINERVIPRFTNTRSSRDTLRMSPTALRTEGGSILLAAQETPVSDPPETAGTSARQI